MGRVSGIIKVFRFYYKRFSAFLRIQLKCLRFLEQGFLCLCHPRHQRH